MLRRAGLDYWPHVDVYEYHSINELYKAYPKGLFYYVENFGEKNYSDYDFSNLNLELFFVFGKETSGIPKALIAGKEERCLQIPISEKVQIGRASCRESV